MDTSHSENDYTQSEFEDDGDEAQGDPGQFPFLDENFTFVKRLGPFGIHIRGYDGTQFIGNGNDIAGYTVAPAWLYQASEDDTPVWMHTLILFFGDGGGTEEIDVSMPETEIHAALVVFVTGAELSEEALEALVA